MADGMHTLATPDNRLGQYLKNRREKLDPAAFGIKTGRRRTPGLRREEVAQRASISPAWYTWLEQGRGGAPSAEVLDRIAEALMLTGVEREHLFLLGLGRPPEVRYQGGGGISPRLQRVLDALNPCPALIRTALWDVVAWNRAVAVVLTDYAALPPENRNVLRFIFLDPRARAAQYDWESVARMVVGTFRVEAARAGAAAAVQPLVDELSARSPDFAAMWRDNDVRAHHGDGVKRIRHPVLGELAFEFSSFAIEGRPDLSMAVYNPLAAEDMRRIAALVRENAGANEATRGICLGEV
jgi:transcriptional regulator with XRE-family HTH domain